MQKKTRRNKRKRKLLIRFFIKQLILLLIIISLGTIIYKQVKKYRTNNETNISNEITYEDSIENSNGDSDEDKSGDAVNSGEYAEELNAALRLNPELKDFVNGYEENKDKDFTIDLSKEAMSGEIPLLMQWDKRWGYHIYAGEPFALSGCGPTCLSMVCIGLLGDPSYTPLYISEYAQNNGYSLDSSGSFWTLISEGGQDLGLDVIEIPNYEQRIIDNLEVGNPIICIMGPGDFTETGHFVVLTKYVHGKIQINDPYRKSNSDKLWEYDEIENQIQNLWVCR